MAQETLPCLSSEVQCLGELTELAFAFGMALPNAHSLEIQSIDEHLVLGDENIDHARQRRWTNYITLDPVRLVQNILGGGDVQRDRLDIAELELRQADLVRRRWEVTEAIASDVIDLVLEWERLDRRVELLVSQLQTQTQRQAVMEAAYRTGAGSTTSMLSVWQRTEDLEGRSLETQIEQNQTRQELERMVFGFAVMDEGVSGINYLVGEVKP
ncbi:MAG: TolC family protein [Moorea sp. SIO3C2]|nr:TolC family protein [Moorena sp. SIO3C2]